VKTNVMEGLMKTEFDGRWRELGGEAMKEIKRWRLSQPKSSLNEIEHALDEQLGWLRAQMLEDLAYASEARHMDGQSAERPRCPQCNEVMISRGQQVRELKTNNHQRSL
jgi:hypothetical protein